MMRALGVPPARIAKAWPLVEGWIASALERGKGNVSPADVRRCLGMATMQLWLAWTGKRDKGCCITEIVSDARGKTCNLVCVAGLEFEQWQPLTEIIKDFARAHGCVRLEASGRAGWERLVKQDGWHNIRTTIEMEL